MGIFYLPKDGVCGDFIPYYNGKRKCYELYYLHDYRGCHGEREGTPWKRITTTDMVHFTEEGEVLPKGDQWSQDMFCYTGCVVEHDNRYHIYYTGHNYHFPEEGRHMEAVMHAVSADGVTWEKQPQDTFFAPDDRAEIERDDWRDPFVFYQEEEQKWWMLLCTRKKEGPSRRRGATGLLTSDDLVHWNYEGSYWDPHMCWCPECPELFSWGEYWYFIYSTFCETEGLQTYYRISRSPRGPWKNPGDNCFDGRAFYAGKTASDGKERYIFGWNPTKTGDVDEGIWQWGGNLIVHKLRQEADGKLSVSMPEKIWEVCPEETNVSLRPLRGSYEEREDGFVLEEPSGTGSILVSGISGTCIIAFDILFSRGTDSGGIMVKARGEGAEGYYLRLEPGRNRFLFDREPCYPHEKAEIQRFVGIAAESWHSVKVILDGTCLLAYLDDKYALSARMYDFDSDKMLFFVNDGQARVRNLKVREWKKEESK
jgi:beta-fructofuranosidase|nr:family 43 glycosylhydrolase [uncultured Acetatifactor sp.]